MKRTFIAIKIPNDNNLNNRLHYIQSKLKNERISWVDKENLHITLSFIGNTSDALILKIKNEIENSISEIKPYEFGLIGLGVFSSIQSPNIIWIGTSDAKPLVNSQTFISNKLERIGIAKENREFTPHLTIGRIHSVNDKMGLKNLIIANKDYKFKTVHVNEIIFYESILEKTGAVYKEITKFKLEI